MNERIVYQNQEGGISIIVPVDGCGLTLEQIIAKDVPPGAVYQVVDVADLPTDRTFRDAWTLQGEAVTVDMPKARQVHRQRLRAMRAPRMAALDVDFMRALETADAARQAEIGAAKQALRAVTDDPRIEAARNPAELAAVIPAALQDPAPTPAAAPRAAARAPRG